MNGNAMQDDIEIIKVQKLKRLLKNWFMAETVLLISDQEPVL